MRLCVFYLPCGISQMKALLSFLVILLRLRSFIWNCMQAYHIVLAWTVKNSSSEDNDVIVSYKPLFQASRLKFKINMADEHKDMFLMFN